VAHLTPVKPIFVHDFALAAMQGLLTSEKAIASVARTADRKDIPFHVELSFQAYDIAQAMMLEAGLRS